MDEFKRMQQLAGLLTENKLVEIRINEPGNGILRTVLKAMEQKYKEDTDALYANDDPPYEGYDPEDDDLGHTKFFEENPIETIFKKLEEENFQEMFDIPDDKILPEHKGHKISSYYSNHVSILISKNIPLSDFQIYMSNISEDGSVNIGKDTYYYELSFG